MTNLRIKAVHFTSGDFSFINQILPIVMTVIGPNFRVGAVTESVSEIREMETLEQVAIPLTDKLTAG